MPYGGFDGGGMPGMGPGPISGGASVTGSVLSSHGVDDRDRDRDAMSVESGDTRYRAPSPFSKSDKRWKVRVC
jgi:hypothetical protein